MSLFMTSDLDMYDEDQDAPCQVNAPMLGDELGQVTHIFSDKTGTLTSNHMEFMRCFIDGESYGCGDTAISRALNKSKGAIRVSTPALHVECMPRAELTALSRALKWLSHLVLREGVADQRRTTTNMGDPARLLEDFRRLQGGRWCEVSDD